MNLNQVTLPVRDMDISTDFYRRLGFLQIVDTPHYARFSCPDDGATFSLSLDEELTDNKSQSGAVIYFEHQELDVWVAEVQQRGIQFEQLPTEQSYLWREATLRDLSGNKIKLYWAGENRLNPPWRVEKTYQA
ncbi:VOC family protein [Colwellia psychrerythraea]|uniref:Glyoxalase-like domain containing protein n=1 Tax=Colwellia psychrerythraea TaxID=28229 RepID=A0A099L709_COLPS|nr:VOC family protein [Colwellia psychrerythraea]KGJ97658.1 Glyoxalase-like domain containing protein [Colwellia psychrerythraea]